MEFWTEFYSLAVLVLFFVQHVPPRLNIFISNSPDFRNIPFVSLLFIFRPYHVAVIHYTFKFPVFNFLYIKSRVFITKKMNRRRRNRCPPLVHERETQPKAIFENIIQHLSIFIIHTHTHTFNEFSLPLSEFSGPSRAFLQIK